MMPTSTERSATSGMSMRKGLAIVAVLAVVAAVAIAVIWHLADKRSESPHVLRARLGGFSFVADPVPVRSSTLQIGIMAPYRGREDAETLTFRSATAHFRRNSANATATISVCLPRQSQNSGLGGGGTVHAATLGKFCRQSRPVGAGTTLQWGTESTDGEFLVLTVHPTRPGVAEIDSFTFDYARDKEHGGQSGIERLGGQKYVVTAS